MDKEKADMIIYTTEDGLTKVETTFDGETVWLSIDQMAELFQRDRSVIGKHVRNIFKEGELEKESVWAKFAYTATDGKVYNVDYYNLDVIISGLSLCAIVVITLAGVIMRKIMNQPIAWLEEMQLLLFIYAIFFGGSVAFRYGNQVSIDLVMNRLKGKAARALEIFDVVVTVIVLIYYCYGGYQLMSSVTKKVTPYFKINYAFIDVAAPIGMILMAIQYIVYTYRHLKGLGNPGDDQKALLKGEEE